ncbi:hypothetical protein ACFLZZ_01700 [Nanoarchaeota archaeon]
MKDQVKTILEGIESTFLSDEKYNGKNPKEDLKLVNYLKSQYYMGTGDAWEIIKLVRNPLTYSNEINKKLGDVKYKATPERVVGVCKSAHKLERIVNEYLDIRGFVDGLNDNFWTDKIGLTMSTFFWSTENPGFEKEINELEVPFKNPEDPLNFSYKETKEAITNIFLEANKKGIDNDQDFGKFVGDYISKKNEEEDISHLGNRSAMIWEIYKRFLNTAIKEFDWEGGLSKAEYSSEVKHISKAFLPSEKIIKNVLRDQVSDRIMYRRQALEGYLTNPAFVEGPVESYDNLMDYFKEMIAVHGKNIEDTKIKLGSKNIGDKEIREYEEEFERKGIKWLDLSYNQTFLNEDIPYYVTKIAYVKEEKEKLQVYKFLYKNCNSEKKFVKRLLNIEEEK